MYIYIYLNRDLYCWCFQYLGSLIPNPIWDVWFWTPEKFLSYSDHWGCGWLVTSSASWEAGRCQAHPLRTQRVALDPIARRNLSSDVAILEVPSGNPWLAAKSPMNGELIFRWWKIEFVNNANTGDDELLFQVLPWSSFFCGRFKSLLYAVAVVQSTICAPDI